MTKYFSIINYNGRQWANSYKVKNIFRPCLYSKHDPATCAVTCVWIRSVLAVSEAWRVWGRVQSSVQWVCSSLTAVALLVFIYKSTAVGGGNAWNSTWGQIRSIYWPAVNINVSFVCGGGGKGGGLDVGRWNVSLCIYCVSIVCFTLLCGFY